jgi:hypothetical protein
MNETQIEKLAFDRACGFYFSNFGDANWPDNALELLESGVLESEGKEMIVWEPMEMYEASELYHLVRQLAHEFKSMFELGQKRPNGISTTTVGYWNEYIDELSPSAKDFEVEIDTRQLDCNGQLTITMSNTSNQEDMFIVGFQVERMAIESNSFTVENMDDASDSFMTQRADIYFDGDNLAFSVIKINDRFLLVPSCDSVRMRSTFVQYRSGGVSEMAYLITD